MVVSDYILLTLFLKFHNVAQFLCNFCPLQLPKKTVEQPNNSQQILFADHHGYNVVVFAPGRFRGREGPGEELGLRRPRVYPDR